MNACVTYKHSSPEHWPDGFVRCCEPCELYKHSMLAKRETRLHNIRIRTRGGVVRQKHIAVVTVVFLKKIG